MLLGNRERKINNIKLGFKELTHQPIVDMIKEDEDFIKKLSKRLTDTELEECSKALILANNYCGKAYSILSKDKQALKMFEFFNLMYK